MTDALPEKLDGDTEALARWWWNTLRARTGTNGPEYDDASEDSKEAVREYIRSTE